MKRLLLLLTLFFTLFTNTAFAIRLTSLYQGQIAVTSQATEDRAQILPQALAQVLVKVSGSDQVLQNLNIKSHLKDANSIMQEFSYESAKNAAKPYLLTVQFDPEAVNKLLRTASAPIWGANRPLILTWIECEDSDNPAGIIDNSATNEMGISLKLHADQRGLPLLLPMMDATDIGQVTVNDIMTMNMPKLTAAAQRYSTDGIVAIRVIKSAHTFSAQAKLMVGKDQWTWQTSGVTSEAALNALVNNISDTLAGRYATVVTNTVQSRLILKVAGINQQDDFAQLMQYLQHLPSVATVQLDKISGEEVVFNVSLRGARDAFADVLSIGKKLTPLPAEPNSTMLAYQWNH